MGLGAPFTPSKGRFSCVRSTHSLLVLFSGFRFIGGGTPGGAHMGNRESNPVCTCERSAPSPLSYFSVSSGVFCTNGWLHPHPVEKSAQKCHSSTPPSRARPPAHSCLSSKDLVISVILAPRTPTRVNIFKNLPTGLPASRPFLGLHHLSVPGIPCQGKETPLCLVAAPPPSPSFHYATCCPLLPCSHRRS